jgi:hypothetical protein
MLETGDAAMPGKGKKPMGVDELESYVKDLRSVAAKLNEIVRQMRDIKVKEIDVMGQKTADLGLTYFGTLIHSCERELRALNLAKKKNGPSR